MEAIASDSTIHIQEDTESKQNGQKDNDSGKYSIIFLFLNK